MISPERQFIETHAFRSLARYDTEINEVPGANVVEKLLNSAAPAEFTPSPARLSVDIAREAVERVRSIGVEYDLTSIGLAIPRIDGDPVEESITAATIEVFGEAMFPSPEERAAKGMYSVVKNHSYHDGNKRAGLATGIDLLHQETGQINAGPMTAAALAVWIARSAPENQDQVQNAAAQLLGGLLLPSLSDIEADLVEQELEHQQDQTPEARLGLSEAYKITKAAATSGLFEQFNPQEMLRFSLDIGAIAKPAQNLKGIRSTPVYFSHGGSAHSPGSIPRALTMWAEGFADPDIEATPAEMYRFFEEIHPFEDGNGRSGWLLWCADIARRTGEWPEELAPLVFEHEQ